MQEFQLTIYGSPPTHTQQERKIAWNAHRTYLDPKAKKDKQRIMQAINNYLDSYAGNNGARLICYPNGIKKKQTKTNREALELPWNEPLELRVIFFYNVSDDRLRRERNTECNVKLWKYTKPDADNLLKALMDSLQETGVIVNDSRIAKLSIEKHWCSEKEARIEIFLTKLNQK